MYFIIKDSSGFVTELLRDDYTAIPAQAIPISDADGQLLSRGFQSYKYLNGILSIDVATQLNAIRAKMSLSPRQVRLILTVTGSRAAAEAAVIAADQNTKDMWQYSSIFLRNDPVLMAMAAGIGITPVQLDQMFVQGAQL